MSPELNRKNIIKKETNTNVIENCNIEKGPVNEVKLYS